MSDNITVYDSSENEKILATKELTGQVHVRKSVLVDESGSFIHSYDPLAVAQGLITGYAQMNKFGENPDVDTGPEDIWDYGGTYTFSSTANIDQMSSSETADTETITITGLDTNWAEVTQIKTLTGRTPVTLDTPLIRVYRAYNSGTADLVGDVYLTTNGAALTNGVPDVANTVRAMIRAGLNQTLMCIYTVPAGVTAYFLSGYVAFSKGRASVTADFTWRARLFGSVFSVKSKIGLSSSGDSTWRYTYGVPVALPEKTDVKIVCEEVSAADSAVSGGFDMILVDN